MIFVTVGMQMPFDRLIRTVDEWAGRNSRDDIVAQIGETEMRPQHIRWSKFLDPESFRQHVSMASVVVAHAGMGSIITALELGKPVLVMPRRGNLKETRNDHQVESARRLLFQGRIQLALDEHELLRCLQQFCDRRSASGERIGPVASEQLIQAIRSLIVAEAQNQHRVHDMEHSV